jgi:hypothetical protein
LREVFDRNVRVGAEHLAKTATQHAVLELSQVRPKKKRINDIQKINLLKARIHYKFVQFRQSSR